MFFKKSNASENNSVKRRHLNSQQIFEHILSWSDLVKFKDIFRKTEKRLCSGGGGLYKSGVNPRYSLFLSFSTLNLKQLEIV